MMKLDRTVIRKGQIQTFQDDGFVQATMKQRVDMVWDITVALWTISTRGKIHAQSRLQRHVAVFSRRRG
jgi:hypothetical protein